MIRRILTKNGWARVVAKISRLGNTNDAKLQVTGIWQGGRQVDIGSLNPDILFLHRKRRGAACN